MDRTIPFTDAMRHRMASAIRPLTDNIRYTVRSGMAAGLTRRGGLGFLPRRTTAEEHFWIARTSSLAGKTVYDVGAYEGIFTLFAARAVANGTVVVFEPGSASYRWTTRNISENRFAARVIALHVGLDAGPGQLTIAWPHGEPARASLNPRIIAQMESEGAPLVRERVEVLRLDDLVKRESLPLPDVIKIDVEGKEYGVLLGAEETIRAARPEIFLELHGSDLHEQLQIQKEVRSILQRWGYRVFRLSGEELQTSDALPGHIYCAPSEQPHVA